MKAGRRRALAVPLTGAIALATLGLGAPAHAADSSSAAGLSSAAGSCEGTPSFDVSAVLGEPYSFTDGSRTRVIHKQWRRTDKNFASVETDRAGTTITLHRSDGRQCGPSTVRWSSGLNAYTASVGTLSNPGHGVWVCINYPGGGRCGATKWE